jgi:hypothetical protein
LTASELQYLLAMQNSKRQAAENAGFKTRAVKEQEEKARERKYPKVGIHLLLFVWSSLKKFTLFISVYILLDNDSSKISR